MLGDFAALRRPAGEQQPQYQSLDIASGEPCVGQRRGLGISAARPQYVVALDVERNAVVLGDDDDLYRRELSCELAWIDEAAARAAAPLSAQIRSRHRAEPVATFVVEEGVARVMFESPQRAIAPGQTIAFFDGDVVVGAGVIVASGLA